MRSHCRTATLVKFHGSALDLRKKRQSNECHWIAPTAPDEELTFIIVGDYDLSFLGMPIEQIAAFEVCDDLCQRTQALAFSIPLSPTVRRSSRPIQD
jgi:hypothetical protein